MNTRLSRIGVGNRSSGKFKGESKELRIEIKNKKFI
jgi:hypothetical protein